MKHLFLAGVAIGVTITGSVFAADMPVKAPAAPPPPDWTGFYIGGIAGGQWTDNTVNVVTTTSFVNFPVLSPAAAASATASSGTVGVGRANGFSGGFEAGYNYQFETYLVLGIEADINYLSGSDSAALTQVIAQPGLPGLNYTSTVAASDHLRYLGTVRGRLGFLFPKSDTFPENVLATLLPYLTGGLAYGGGSSSTAITGGETPNTGSSNIAGAGAFSGTRVGWTIGGGVEWLLSRNWTVKAEYLHYQLAPVTYSNGTMTSSLTPLPGPVAFSDVSNTTVKFSGDILRAGLNYKF